MKRLFLTMATCLAFTAAFVAQSTQQTSPNNTPKPADSSPDSQQVSAGNAENKSEKKLKGCIRSENGKYVLETKHDKMVSLTGSHDFAPHVGHTVTLHGKFVNDSSSAGAMSENPGTGTGDSTPTGAAHSGASSTASPSTGSNSADAMSENAGTGTGDSTPTGAARTGASSAASPYTGSSSTRMSATGNSSSGEGSNFQVTKMDMVSDRCTLEGRNGMKGGKESSPDHR